MVGMAGRIVMAQANASIVAVKEWDGLRRRVESGAAKAGPSD